MVLKSQIIKYHQILPFVTFPIVLPGLPVPLRTEYQPVSLQHTEQFLGLGEFIEQPMPMWNSTWNSPTLDSNRISLLMTPEYGERALMLS